MFVLPSAFDQYLRSSAFSTFAWRRRALESESYAATSMRV
jgi:hypothetical protein